MSLGTFNLIVQKKINKYIEYIFKHIWDLLTIHSYLLKYNRMTKSAAEFQTEWCTVADTMFLGFKFFFLFVR